MFCIASGFFLSFQSLTIGENYLDIFSDSSFSLALTLQSLKKRLVATRLLIPLPSFALPLWLLILPLLFLLLLSYSDLVLDLNR